VIDEEAQAGVSSFYSQELQSSGDPSLGSLQETLTLRRGGGDNLSSSSSALRLTQLIPSSVSPGGPSQCYFCHKLHPPYLLPVCNGWVRQHTGSENRGDGNHRQHSHSHSQSPESHSGNSGSGSATTLSLCTPYTTVVKTRDEYKELLEQKQEEVQRLQSNYDTLVSELISLNKSLEEVKGEKRLLTERLCREEKEWNDRMRRERDKRSEDISRIIGEHNKQLSEVKRLYREKSHEMRKKTTTSSSSTGIGGGVDVGESVVEGVLGGENEQEKTSVAGGGVEINTSNRRDHRLVKEKSITSAPPPISGTKKLTEAPPSSTSTPSHGTFGGNGGGISLFPTKSLTLAAPNKHFTTASTPAGEASSTTRLSSPSPAPPLPSDHPPAGAGPRSAVGGGPLDEKGVDEEDDADLPFDVFLSSMHDIQRMLLDLETGAAGGGDEERLSTEEGREGRMAYARHLFE
jgi:hypothetical protein